MRIFALFYILFWFGSAAAQPGAASGRITGRVVDSSTKEPLAYATVSAFAKGSTSVAGGMITDDQGKFSIEGLAIGEYYLKVDFIGYRIKIRNGLLVTDASPVASAGDLAIASNTNAMKEVTVSGSRNFMENKLDKFVYNVEKDITSQTGAATDVLKKVPQVSVDINGNVELQGNANIRVFVNGKASTAFDNNLANALAAIPANQIKSIEVITSPGAQYDAQGTGGIINIILKDNKSQGINGNASVTVGTLQENASLNLHGHTGNVDINASYFRNQTLKRSTLSSTDRSAADGSYLHQTGTGDFERFNQMGTLGMDWAINKRNDLTAEVMLYDMSSTSGNTTSQLQHTPGSTDTPTLRNATTISAYRSWDWNVHYKKTYDTAGRELSLSYQGSTSMSPSDYNQQQAYMPLNLLYNGAKGNNSHTDYETYLTADYAHPFSKDVMLNAGAKATLYNTYTRSEYYLLNLGTDNYDFDPSQLDQFNYTRNVYAAYGSLTFLLFKKFNIKLGIRDEYTFSQYANDSGKAPAYNSFIPSGVISRKLEHNQTIKLSYSRRIQRPWLGDLDPFVNAADPTSLTRGNPYLLPEKVHNVEFSYNKYFEQGSSYFISLYCRYSTSDMQSYVSYYDSLQLGNTVYRNVSVSSDVNAGTQTVTGLNLSGTLSVSKKLEVRVNVAMFNKYIVSPLDGGSTASSFNYRINGNASYQFSKTLAAECFGNFRSAQTEIQGRFPSYASYSFAMRKTFMDKKLSVAFTTNNPFNKYTDQATNIAGANFTLISDRKIPNQSFGLNISYKFGKIEYKERGHSGPGRDE